jgi:hypothetical protein
MVEILLAMRFSQPILSATATHSAVSLCMVQLYVHVQRSLASSVVVVVVLLLLLPIVPSALIQRKVLVQRLQPVTIVLAESAPTCTFLRSTSLNRVGVSGQPS